MEDGLRAKGINWLRNLYKSLNPCSCGGWSQSWSSVVTELAEVGLNPCSCGGWSQRLFKIFYWILFVCLNPCSCGGWSQRAKKCNVMTIRPLGVEKRRRNIFLLKNVPQ